MKYSSFSRLFPRKRIEWAKKLYDFSGSAQEFDEWIGQKIFVGLLFALIGFLLPWTLFKYFALIDFTSFLIPLMLSIVFAAVLFILIAILYYLHVYYAIEDRTKRVEAILPDFLSLLSSNLRSGMTPFAAFRSSARNEFGPLNEEIKAATSKSLGTESFNEALSELAKRINSKVLKEFVSFFVQGMISGGHITRLLESSSDDLVKTQEMKKELISSTRMYIIFVAFIIVIATPLLLSISLQFLSMIQSIQAQNTTSGLASTPGLATGFLNSKINISTQFMFYASLILLIGNALLASIFVGVIAEGKTKNGLKYFLPMLVSSVILFFVFKEIISSFLSVLG